MLFGPWVVSSTLPAGKVGATQLRDANYAVAAVTSKKMGPCLKQAVIKGASKGANGALTVVAAHATPISESVVDMHIKLWDILVTFNVKV